MFCLFWCCVVAGAYAKLLLLLRVSFCPAASTVCCCTAVLLYWCAVALGYLLLWQVHRARLLDGTEVAMKIQYPGVADSVESDLKNLQRLVQLTNILPPGLYIDEIIEVSTQQ